MNIKSERAQTGIWEGLIMILLIAALVGCGFLIWNLMKNQNAIQNTYQANSNPMVTQNEPNIHPLCGAIFTWNGREKNASTNKTDD